jgi:predicted ABC-type ATPase
MASRSFHPWLVKLRKSGYHVHILFLWLESVELALSRVAERVRLGGHAVPDDIMRRRYEKGIHNFFRVYMPIADSWEFLDNSSAASPRLIASGEGQRCHVLSDADSWRRLMERYDG